MKYFLIFCISTVCLSSENANHYKTIQSASLIEELEKNGPSSAKKCIEEYRNLQKSNTDIELDKTVKCILDNSKDGELKKIKEIINNKSQDFSVAKSNQSDDQQKKIREKLAKDLGVQVEDLSKLSMVDFLKLNKSRLSKQKKNVFSKYCIDSSLKLKVDKNKSDYNEELIKDLNSSPDEGTLKKCRDDLQKDSCQDSKTSFACKYRIKILKINKALKANNELIKKYKDLPKSPFATESLSISKKQYNKFGSLSESDIDKIFGDEDKLKERAEKFEEDVANKDKGLMIGDLEALEDYKLQLEIENEIKSQEINDEQALNQKELIRIAESEGFMTKEQLANLSEKQLRDKVSEYYKNQKEELIKELDQKYSKRFLSKHAGDNDLASRSKTTSSLIRHKNKIIKKLFQYNSTITAILEDEKTSRSTASDPSFVDIFKDPE